jgi:hypothetical protein
MSSESKESLLKMCKRLEKNLLAESQDEEYRQRQLRNRIQRHHEQERIIQEFNSKHNLIEQDKKEINRKLNEEHFKNESPEEIEATKESEEKKADDNKNQSAEEIEDKGKST